MKYKSLLSIFFLLSKITDSEIEAEDEEEALSIEAFEKTFNEQWADSYKSLGIGMIKRLIKEKNETMTLSACLRNYFIGPDILAQLTKDQPDEEKFYHRLINSIKTVQFIDEERIRIPNRFGVAEEDGSEWEYIVITPGQEQLMLKTEFIILHPSKDEYLKLPYEELEKYALSHFKRLDEKQFIFPELSVSEFYSLMEHFGFQRETQKEHKRNWWEFWK